MTAPQERVAGDRGGGGDDRDVGLERIVFFSDAVFAIVITVLVLPLAAEVDVQPGVDLASVVGELWPRIVAFLISFLVVGQFWIAHHRLFESVRSYDLTVMWLNLLALMGVTFIPFPTALLGGYEGDRFAGIFYTGSLTAVSLMFAALWLVARSRGHLTDDQAGARVFTVRAITTVVMFAAAVVIAATLPYGATLTWLVCIPVGRAVVTRAIVDRLERR